MAEEMSNCQLSRIRKLAYDWTSGPRTVSHIARLRLLPITVLPLMNTDKYKSVSECPSMNTQTSISGLIYNTGSHTHQAADPHGPLPPTKKFT